MFSGTADAVLPGTLDQNAVYSRIEDSLGRLGRVRVNSRGEIDIEPRDSLKNLLTNTTISGLARKRGNEWTVDMDYTCTLSPGGWAIGAVGILFFFFGFLVFLGPLMAKGNVEKAVRRGLRDLEADPTPLPTAKPIS